MAIAHILCEGIYQQLPSRIYRFVPFYHPFACAFLEELREKGADGLLSRETQGRKGDEDEFQNTYGPNTYGTNRVFVPKAYDPVERVEFGETEAYSIYNWELIF